MYKKFATSSFIRSVIMVVSGTAGAQVLTMLFAPIITRFYGAEAFGLLGTFTAVLAILVPIAALAYPIAIVLPKNDDYARAIAKLSIYISMLVSTIILVSIILFSNDIADLLNIQTIENYLILVPFALFFAAAEQVMQQWLIRKKQFKIMARVAVSQSLILNSSKVGIGYFSPLGFVLVILATLGNALYAFQLWIGSYKTTAPNDRITYKKIDFKRVKEVALIYRDFPLYRAPQQFINALSQSLPILMLASFFGPASAGFYTLAKTVMAIPSTLVGKAVGDVFYPRITEAAHNNENLYQLIKKATFALAALGFLPFMSVILFGPWLFGFVFGEEWVLAGEYARWLSVWIYFMFMNPPSNKAIPILEIQGFYLFFTFFTIFLRLIALLVGYFVFKSDVISVMLFSITGAVINIAIITIVLWKSHKFNIGRYLND
ncbi:lipopolysaccharide biosynthesis protein [Pseudoalteromonas sp. SR43-2]|uniref:lipopolysaccharide biosynthesis protein n=1 Tax=Pseudoalteromonas sp. SR43-2 TaxID=2760944 RepID=UPI0015FDFAFE|nr:oligosaccharide flippase family protein [Pseudoalteromonas sp. SR43-2]MBB1379348.1 oligosaccharide flippase family protein [Pseudoalteromonas sp. SR43-2]